MTLTAATPCGWLLARDWLKCVTNTSLFDSCRNNGKHRRSGGRELEPASCSALRKHGILQSPVLQMRSLRPREVQPAPVPPKARRRPAGCRLASTLPTPAPEAPPLPRPLGSRLQPPLTSGGRDHVSPSLLLASQAGDTQAACEGQGFPRHEGHGTADGFWDPSFPSACACCEKRPQTGHWRQQKLTLSRFWGPDARNAGVVRPLRPGTPGESPGSSVPAPSGGGAPGLRLHHPGPCPCPLVASPTVRLPLTGTVVVRERGRESRPTSS